MRTSTTILDPLERIEDMAAAYGPSGWSMNVEHVEGRTLRGFYEFIVDPDPGFYFALRANFTATSTGVDTSPEALLFTHLEFEGESPLLGASKLPTHLQRIQVNTTRARCIARSYQSWKSRQWTRLNGNAA